MSLLDQLTRAHPQSTDGEMRHRAAADITRLTAENRQILAVLQDTTKVQREILTGLQAAKATIAALTARVKELEAVLNEAITKVENDRTMWNEEWLVWVQDARAALKEPRT